MARKVTAQRAETQETTRLDREAGDTVASQPEIEEAKTKLAKMNLVDQFLFDEVMKYPDAFEAAVSILVSRDIRLLGKAETEKEFGISPELRKSRMDSVGMDEDHIVYMMEMQKRNTRNLRKRSRFYQGHVDVSLMAPGTADFNSLKDVCQIMVTPFDVFDRGLYRYTFRSVCVECPDLEMGDGAWRVFINTKGKNPDEFTREFLDFMEYITKSTDAQAKASESERIKTIHKRVTEVKQSEKIGVRLMQRWEEIILERDEAREEGKREGKAEGKADSILTLLEDLGIVPDDVTARIRGQKDEGMLSSWLKFAARATGIEEFRKTIETSEGKLAG